MGGAPARLKGAVTNYPSAEPQSKLAASRNLPRATGNLELAVSVDEDESGVANDVFVEVGHARTRGQQRIANWHALYELALQIWVFAGEAEDHEALVAVLAVDLVELGHLFAAGLAPRGPDVHENHLSSLVLQTLQIPLNVRSIERRCGHVLQRQIASLLPSNDALADGLPSEPEGEDGHKQAGLRRKGKRPAAMIAQREGSGEEKWNGHGERGHRKAKEPVLLAVMAELR